MKRPALASLLNFVVPGAGLWYLGLRAWAAVNFCVATTIVLAAVLLGPGLFEDYLHYVLFAVAAGSAGLAHAVAGRQRTNNPTDQGKPVPGTPSRLAEAFMDDHRQMTRCLSRLLASLKEDQTAQAVEIAGELDRIAGPHIRFEEELFYPLLADLRGSEFADRLYEEHRIGRDAVRSLVEHDPSVSLPPAVRETLIEGVQTAIDHALSCGSLLSYVTTLDDATQAELLAKLQRLRDQPLRWSQLPRQGKDAAQTQAEKRR